MCQMSHVSLGTQVPRLGVFTRLRGTRIRQFVAVSDLHGNRVPSLRASIQYNFSTVWFVLCTVSTPHSRTTVHRTHVP